MQKINDSNNSPLYPFKRRSGKDRRKSWRGILPFIFAGRRRNLRREEDRRKIRALDHYSPRLFCLVIVVLMLSLLDAFLTLWLIDHGAIEINPIMNYYLGLGVNAFVAIKYMITVVAVTIVVLSNHLFSRILRIQLGSLLKVFAGCFSLVVAWELFLIAQITI